MQVALFDYELPPELIAQEPAARRDASRLMVLDRRARTITHHQFGDLVAMVGPGDCLVLNDTRVIPARLRGRLERTGGKVELLLLRALDERRWEALGRPGRRLRPGARVVLGGGAAQATVLERQADGTLVVRLDRVGWPSRPTGEPDRQARRLSYANAELLEAIGEMPLPPYIKRPEPRAEDRERYQTVYAAAPGAVAAPTAGLHFTPEVLGAIEARGAQLARVTLHVGLGTFRPVEVERVEEHTMHAEWYDVPPEAAKAVNAARAAGGRVIAVGTTSVRTLETAWDGHSLVAGSGWTRAFIYPGYTFAVTDALLTNFHLPRSTLLMLVAALAGREFLLEAYAEAARLRYRFYSYGDCMLIV